MVKYLVAVSGGVDSVVLLDRLAKSGEHQLIVAHFDHGIRNDSADDARFVAGLAARYEVPFLMRREELGASAGEERARSRRYAFLRSMAKECDATIVTAHHSDDIIETIAINIQRGTGWRGAAVLQTSGIVRPLLELSKQDIYEYALDKRLEWVEDSTNGSDQYLRNRLRRRIAMGMSGVQKTKVLNLWRQQVELKAAIDQAACAFSRQSEYSRYFISQIDELSAVELLRAAIVEKAKASPTRPQLTRAVVAIKTARPNTTYEIGAGVLLKFNLRTFIVETP